ncbi:MAG: glycosyltransferase family 4 protein [bacterium]
MNVLVLTSLFPNRVNPVLGVFVKERVKALAQICDVRVVAPVPWMPLMQKLSRGAWFANVASKETVEGLEVVHPRYCNPPKLGRCLYGFFYYLAVLPHLKRVYLKFPFDIIDAHWAYPDGFAGVLLGRYFNRPVTITVRGTDINEYPSRPVLRPFVKRALKQADRVFAVSQALGDAVENLGIDRSNIRVFPNGVNLKKFHPIDKKAARRFLNLPVNQRIILSVGQLTSRKGFHHLIRAAALLRPEFRNLLLVIVGGEFAGEPKYARKLKQLIRDLHLQNVVLLPGQQSPDQLHQWYSAADLFCLASSREGWPNVVLEAFACGTPVVATEVWGTPEVICSEEYGILIPNQNYARIAECVKRALSRNWNCQRITEYARSHSWDKVAFKIKEEYQQISALTQEKMHLVS